MVPWMRYGKAPFFRRLLQCMSLLLAQSRHRSANGRQRIPAAARLSPRHAARHRRLPIAAVEMVDGDCADVDVIEAAHVHVDHIRIGTRNIKWMNPARGAKRVLGDAGIEAICRQRILAALELKGFLRHHEMKKTLFAADRAIAFGDARQIRGHAKAHPPTMATALISLQRELSGVMAGIAVQRTASWSLS